MIRTLIFCLSCLLSVFAVEETQSNNLNISDIISAIGNMEKMTISVPNHVVYTYYIEGSNVIAISSANTITGDSYALVLPKKESLKAIYYPNKYDFIESIFWEDKPRGILTKRTADIFDVDYMLDQHDRIKRYRCIDNEVFFFKRKGYTSKVVCSRGQVESRNKMVISNHVLGEMESYVLKGFEGEIILVIMDGKPYFPRLDSDGSLRELRDPKTDEIVAKIEFSKEGHVVNYSGGFHVPFCFKGMYQEKISELYFDVNIYYDADLKSFLTGLRDQPS